MSSTDQAFIRVFHSHALPQAAAPHVSFAARGVQLAAGFEPIIVRGGSEDSAPPEAAEAAPVAVATPPKAPPSKPKPTRDRGAATYLPSAFRNLVDVEAPATPPTRQIHPHQQHRMPEREPHQEPLPRPRDMTPPRRDLRPALEVDALHWPRVATQMLEECAGELSILGEALEAAREAGERVIVFHSTTPGAGSTTLTLAMARLLAQRGRSVAVVDAEFTRPHLARSVGLSLDEGWERTLRESIDLAEFVVRSLEDRVSIVPLAGPLEYEEMADRMIGDRVASAWQLLAAHYDLVLVDGGCPAACGESAEDLTNLLAATAAGCVVISPNIPRGNAASASPLVDAGLPVAGIVENASGNP